MKINRNIVSLIPITMLVVSGASNFIDFTASGYYLLGDILGYSLFTDAFMLYIVFKLRFCVYSRIAVIGLCLLTVVSLLNPLINYETYAKLYDTVIVAASLLFCAIFYKR